MSGEAIAFRLGRTYGVCGAVLPQGLTGSPFCACDVRCYWASTDGIELCPPGHRFMITMVASFIEMAGQFLMPGLAALCRDWQVLQAVIICPFLLMLFYWVDTQWRHNTTEAYENSVVPNHNKSLRWLMATQQFEASKELILQFTHKNRMNTESDIKGVVPGHRMDESVHRMDDAVGMKLLSVPHLLQNLEELEKEITRRPKKVCIVKVVGTRNLWKNIVVLCVNSLTGYGIHHCFAKSMMGHEAKMAITHNFYADYYTMAGIALASCLAMCPVVGFLGRRGGLLLFMILTALASLLQLGLLNYLRTWLEEGGGRWLQSSSPFPSAPVRHDVFPSYGAIVSANNVASSLARMDHARLYNPGSDILPLPAEGGMSDSVKDKFSTAFSIVGMFSSHAVGSLSVFFCAEITPTVISLLDVLLQRLLKLTSGPSRGSRYNLAVANTDVNEPGFCCSGASLESDLPCIRGWLCRLLMGGGLGLVLASAGFGRLTAPIMELHNQKGYFLHHVIFACCTLICIICILLLPESKNQNLPENIPDGEHYTRQPLLPHKKGEQPLLLTNSELKDYSGLHDSAAVSDGISENTTANGMKSM
ncbi:hypothetical protein QYF61_003252 [Mycteria americana]|uniref:Solute carrier family 22 member 23 n=1 Tax=Mycteria americana TaxID=33587 RepID=A0AAN7NJ75_MYCAM|nr:hypothetical protein QYF61_003252 [Mycteria americana]